MTRRIFNRRELFKGAGAGTLSLAAAVSVGSASSAHAQSPEAKIEGTWTAATHLLTGPGAPGQFRGMYTYVAGGGLVETDQSERTPPLAGPGHGIWTPIGTHGFRFKLLKYSFDEKGAPMGVTKIRGVATFTAGDAYTSQGTYVFYDNAGHAQGGGRFSESATRVFFG